MPRESFFRAMRYACQFPAIRRELLWLRAMQERDLATARGLERLEPGLRESTLPIRRRAEAAADPAECYAREYDRVLETLGSEW